MAIDTDRIDDCVLALLLLGRHDGQRVWSTDGTGPYLLVDGTLDKCIREFMAKPTPLRHLYEIHTAPQPPLVSAVLSGEHIVELARLRDFL
jgi:hypothetical protein